MIYASRASRCAISPAVHFVSMPFPRRADFRLAPSHWETSLQSNAVSHWLGANLESALLLHDRICVLCYWHQIYYVIKLTMPHFYTDSSVTDSSSMTMASNGNISALCALCEGTPPVTGGFASQRPVTGNFDVFFVVRLNKRLSKQSEMLVIWDAIALTMTSL